MTTPNSMCKDKNEHRHIWQIFRIKIKCDTTIAKVFFLISFVVLVLLLLITIFFTFVQILSCIGSQSHTYNYGFRQNYEVFPDVYVKVALLEGKHILKVTNTIFGGYFHTQ